MGSLKEYMVEALSALVQIPSVNPPGDERRIAEQTAALLSECGIEARVEAVAERRANAVGVLKGSRPGPTFVLNGHLDTVPVEGDWDYDPFSATVENGRLYGLGAADMKGAIAAMLGAARLVVPERRKLRGTLMFSFVADEERKNLGVLDFLQRHRGVDHAVIGEPTSLQLVTSHRGVMRFRVRTLGKAAHASSPALGENAIYQMSRVIDGCARLAESYRLPGSEYYERPSLAATMIQGGVAENIVPDACELTIDRRTVSGESPEQVRNELRGILQEIKKRDRRFSYSLEEVTSVGAWKAQGGSIVVRHGIEAFRECFGKEPVLGDLGATCEATLFDREGVDTMVFGPGDMAAAHTRNESVELLQLEQAAEFYFELMKMLMY